jgi:ATP-dependent DNA ligase
MNFGEWWRYPQKPVRVNESIFEEINPDEYTLERKFDGHRLILIREENSIKFYTREKRIIEIPTNLLNQLQYLNIPKGTVLDGEIWTPTKRGSWRHNRDVVCSATFWDTMRFGYKNISNLPLSERRKFLLEVIPDGLPDLSFVLQEEVSLSKCLEIKKEAGKHKESTNAKSGFIHGVVLKRLDSPRRDNAVRSVEHPDWLKIIFF